MSQSCIKICSSKLNAEGTGHGRFRSSAVRTGMLVPVPQQKRTASMDRSCVPAHGPGRKGDQPASKTRREPIDDIIELRGGPPKILIGCISMTDHRIQG